jgi:hypothetical protein
MRCFTLIALLFLASDFLHAACVPVGASDGMMATVICYPDPQPVQPRPEFSTPSFDFGSAGLNLSPPSSTSGSGMTLHTAPLSHSSNSGTFTFDLSPTLISLPNTSLPSTPQITTRPTFQLPTFTPPAGDLAGMQASADAARAAAGAAGAIFYYTQQAAFSAAKTELDESQKAVDEWSKTNTEQLEVQINSEFTAIDATIEDSTELNNADLKDSIDSDGLLHPNMVTDPSMRVLSDKLALKSNVNTREGRLVRQILNRAFALADPKAGAQQTDTLKTAAVMSVGADLALSEGRDEDAARLLRAAGVTLDIAIGFVPIASSLNDATQIVFGLMTGRDYNGNVMTASDYSLRAAGIVIGLLPAGAATLRFGAMAVNRASLVTAKWIRRLPIAKVDEMAKAAGLILANPVGAVGEGIAAIIRYRRIFPDFERFQAMMSAISPHNSQFTKAGRALTKHPEVLGFDSDRTLRAVYNRPADLNLAAQALVERILTHGKQSKIYMQTIGAEVIEFVLPNRVAARFSKDNFEFITFIKANE